MAFIDPLIVPYTDIRIFKHKGKWQVQYARLWDSPYNWAYPNHKENVIKAIAHCGKLNAVNSQNTSNGTSS